MSAPLDTKKIWDSLMADPAFTAGMPEQAQPVFRELVDDLPAVLVGQLDRAIDLPAMMEAKLAVTEHCLDSGFVEKLFGAIPADLLPMPVGEMAAMMTDALKMFRTPLMEMIRDAPAFLARCGATERQLLASAQGGRFSAATLAAYDAGTLTIRSLLETQPSALLLNGDG